MKLATGLTLVGIGAVLAFAVNGHPWFLNLQITGWIIMAIGLAGLVIPRSGYGWLRRQMVVRRGPDGRQVAGVRQSGTPPYIMINPAAAAEPPVGGEHAPIPGIPAQAEPKDWVDTTRVVPKEEIVSDEESVQEFFRE